MYLYLYIYLHKVERASTLIFANKIIEVLHSISSSLNSNHQKTFQLYSICIFYLTIFYIFFGISQKSYKQHVPC